MNPTPLIFLPSPFLTGRRYKPLIEALCRDQDIHVLELPESGRRFSRKSTWNTKEYAVWVIEQLGSKRINDFRLLGHSMSGPVAALVANRCGPRAKGLVLISTAGIQEQRLFRLYSGRIRDIIFEEPGFSVFAAPALLWNLFAHPRNFKAQFMNSLKAASPETFDELYCPTLLAWGKRDHTFPLSQALKLREQMSEAQLYISEEGSHNWLLTEVSEFREVLNKFFKST